MSKFHINPKTGEPGLCRAHGGNCPFGSADQHFNSAEDARSAYEQQASGEFSSMGAIKRPAAAVATSFNKDTIADAARSVFSGLIGGKSYEERIADAKSRAAYATNYYAGGSDAKKGAFLDGQTSVASASVASRTQDALRARSVAVDNSRVMAHATPAANPGNTLAAIDAANRAASAGRGLGISRVGFTI